MFMARFFFFVLGMTHSNFFFFVVPRTITAQVIEGGNNKKQKPAYGADVLRLWVSSVDYSGDVCVGDHIIKQVLCGSAPGSQYRSSLPLVVVVIVMGVVVVVDAGAGDVVIAAVVVDIGVDVGVLFFIRAKKIV